jgi:sugar/nucleoside kinase (ribokinase family)
MSRRLRIVASGTLFITHTLTVSSLPNQNSTRASAVRRERGGASATVLSILAQFTHVEAYLVAPVGGGPEGTAMIKELETAGVRTRLCAKRDASGVPAAYVICAGSVVFFECVSGCSFYYDIFGGCGIKRTAQSLL